jgi:hypothetical protein
MVFGRISSTFSFLAELISFSARENSAGASFGMVEHAIKLRVMKGVERRRMGY